MKITLCPCKSSQIHAHGFDPATGTLALQFKSKKGPGSVYYYQNFSQEKYDAFRNSESLGRYFGQHIKDNTDFPYRKIEAEQKGDDAPAEQA